MLEAGGTHHAVPYENKDRGSSLAKKSKPRDMLIHHARMYLASFQPDGVCSLSMSRNLDFLQHFFARCKNTLFNIIKNALYRAWTKQGSIPDISSTQRTRHAKVLTQIAQLGDRNANLMRLDSQYIDDIASIAGISSEVIHQLTRMENTRTETLNNIANRDDIDLETFKNILFHNHATSETLAIILANPETPQEIVNLIIQSRIDPTLDRATLRAFHEQLSHSNVLHRYYRGDSSFDVLWETVAGTDHSQSAFLDRDTLHAIVKKNDNTQSSLLAMKVNEDVLQNCLDYVITTAPSATDNPIPRERQRAIGDAPIDHITTHPKLSEDSLVTLLQEHTLPAITLKKIINNRETPPRALCALILHQKHLIPTMMEAIYAHPNMDDSVAHALIHHRHVPKELVWKMLETFHRFLPKSMDGTQNWRLMHNILSTALDILNTAEAINYVIAHLAMKTQQGADYILDNTQLRTQLILTMLGCKDIKEEHLAQLSLMHSLHQQRPSLPREAVIGIVVHKKCPATLQQHLITADRGLREDNLNFIAKHAEDPDTIACILNHPAASATTAAIILKKPTLTDKTLQGIAGKPHLTTAAILVQIATYSVRRFARNIPISSATLEIVAANPHANRRKVLLTILGHPSTSSNSTVLQSIATHPESCDPEITNSLLSFKALPESALLSIAKRSETNTAQRLQILRHTHCTPAASAVIAKHRSTEGEDLLIIKELLVRRRPADYNVLLILFATHARIITRHRDLFFNHFIGHPHTNDNVLAAVLKHPIIKTDSMYHFMRTHEKAADNVLIALMRYAAGQRDHTLFRNLLEDEKVTEFVILAALEKFPSFITPDIINTLLNNTIKSPAICLKIITLPIVRKETLMEMLQHTNRVNEDVLIAIASCRWADRAVTEAVIKHKRADDMTFIALIEQGKISATDVMSTILQWEGSLWQSRKALSQDLALAICQHVPLADPQFQQLYDYFSPDHSAFQTKMVEARMRQHGIPARRRLGSADFD